MIEIGPLDIMSNGFNSIIRFFITLESILEFLFFYPVGIALTLYLAYIIIQLCLKIYSVFFIKLCHCISYLIDLITFIQNIPLEHLFLESIYQFFSTLIFKFLENISLFAYIRSLKLFFFIFLLIFTVLYF